jgi:hypothetical protein
MKKLFIKNADVVSKDYEFSLRTISFQFLRSLQQMIS